MLHCHAVDGLYKLLKTTPNEFPEDSMRTPGHVYHKEVEQATLESDSAVINYPVCLLFSPLVAVLTDFRMFA